MPPDPKDVAPPLDQTVATNIFDATAFLYTGDNPIQKGVAAGTIESKRVAVLRGKVLDRDGNPLPWVKITILNHPEYGQTLSRADGMFDMVVNGGGLLNVRYEKKGYLTVQRQKDIPWQDYMTFPDVIMTTEDPNITLIDLNDTSADFQVIRGSAISDERGNRQSTVLIPRGDQAWMVFPDEHEEPITSLTVRATEYTAGPMGPEAMPAELPSTSAYTYCEEFTVEEAKAAGAPEVRFSQPVISYNENFLNFPVGTAIPLGAYNRERAVWIPSDNGKVIKILNISGSLAELDTDGDNIIDNGVSLGITDAERAALANLYLVGQSLWRVLVPHFTRPWDKNMGVMCEEPCFEPKNPPPWAENPKCVDEATGSIIECQSQVLAENIPITGTPYHLHYQSDRVKGRTEKYTLAIPLTGATISPTMKKVTLAIEVAGQKIVREYAPAANLSDTFTWDGKDVYGRVVQGAQTITVQIGYGYRLVYGFTNRFGYNGSGIPISVSAEYFTLWQVHKVPIETIGTWDAKGQGLGGWTLNVHHAYDLTGWAIQGGDGEHYGAPGAIVKTVAGGGLVDGDEVQATMADITGPRAIAVGPDGSLYIAEWGKSRIRKVKSDGIITTVAGTGIAGYSGDGGPAKLAQINYPEDIALGPDGSLYIADTLNHRVRRIGPDGIIQTVAGNGTCPYCVYGCPPLVDAPATEVNLCNPSSVSVGSDGSLYILHILGGVARSFIRKVAPDGTITRLAGADYQPPYAVTGDGGLAVDAGLGTVYRIRAGRDGSLYMTMGYDGGRRIRRITPDGFINTIAGGDGYCGARGWNGDPACGDGGPAIGAQFYDIGGIGMGGESGFFVIDPSIEVIRQVGPDGIINTVAGSWWAWGFAGDGGLATKAIFGGPSDVAMGPDGSLYIADRGNNNRIRKVSAALPEMLIGYVPSEDGNELYRFNLAGRHLQTLDALTGAVLYTFEYDTKGLLTKVTDRDGNITIVQRDASGNPLSILSPYGQQTNVTLDANGYLSSITNPAGETTTFTYTADGLMTGMKTPRNFAYTYFYDSLGRLQKDQDPASGYKSLNRIDQTNGHDVILTTGMGRVTTYSLENLSTGDQHQITTYPDGTQADILNRKDGSSTANLPDGTTINTLIGPDPRFSMVAPLLKSMTFKTPGGLVMNVAENRAVNLTDPHNPLSLTSLTDTITENGQTYTMAYNAATKRSPTPRQSAGRVPQRSIRLAVLSNHSYPD